MSYNPISTNEIATGEPVASGTQTKIKDNFDNHEARVTAIEGGVNVPYPPIILRVNGVYSNIYIPSTGLIKTTSNFNLTITGIRLLIDKAGTAGTTEIDIKVKSGIGSYNSVLTTKPSVAYSAGSDAISSNAVLNPSYTSVLAGDIIRLDLTTVQTEATGFLVRIDFNKT